MHETIRRQKAAVVPPPPGLKMFLCSAEMTDDSGSVRGIQEAGQDILSKKESLEKKKVRDVRLKALEPKQTLFRPGGDKNVFLDLLLSDQSQHQV